MHTCGRECGAGGGGACGGRWDFGFVFCQNRSHVDGKQVCKGGGGGRGLWINCFAELWLGLQRPLASKHFLKESEEIKMLPPPPKGLANPRRMQPLPSCQGFLTPSSLLFQASFKTLSFESLFSPYQPLSFQLPVFHFPFFPPTLTSPSLFTAH